VLKTLKASIRHPVDSIQIKMEGTTLDHRQLLPTNVKPVHYALIVKPDFTTFTYPGKVAINLDILEDSNEVSLHTLDLQIKIGLSGSYRFRFWHTSC
jgi:hypothetical protein